MCSYPKGYYRLLNFLEEKKLYFYSLSKKQESVQSAADLCRAWWNGKCVDCMCNACVHVCPGSWGWAQLLCADPTVRCPGTGWSWRCSNLVLPPAPSPLRWGRKDAPPWRTAESGVRGESLSWKDTESKSSAESCATSSLAVVSCVWLRSWKTHDCWFLLQSLERGQNSSSGTVSDNSSPALQVLTN